MSLVLELRLDLACMCTDGGNVFGWSAGVPFDTRKEIVTRVGVEYRKGEPRPWDAPPLDDTDAMQVIRSTFSTVRSVVAKKLTIVLTLSPEVTLTLD